MVKRNIFVKGMEEDMFLKFKARAVESKMTLGEAFNEAMQLWLKSKKK